MRLTHDDIEALRESWRTVGMALPPPSEWSGDLRGSFAALDYFITDLTNERDGNNRRKKAG